MADTELKGKISLVTGASRGLRKEIALKLASEGARVAINYLSSDEKAREVAEKIESVGGEALLLKANVADSGQSSTGRQEPPRSYRGGQSNHSQSEVAHDIGDSHIPDKRGTGA